jgi:hypothetical protein
MIRDSTHFWNVGQYRQDYMAQYTRKLPSLLFVLEAVRTWNPALP